MSTINYNDRATFLGEAASNSYAKKQKFYNYIDDEIDCADFYHLFEHMIRQSDLDLAYSESEASWDSDLSDRYHPWRNNLSDDDDDDPIGWTQDMEDRYVAANASESKREWMELDVEYGYYASSPTNSDSIIEDVPSLIIDLDDGISDLNPNAEEFIPFGMKREITIKDLQDRLHKVGFDNLLATPQAGVEFNHNIHCQPLERVVNGVCDFFSGAQSEYDTARSTLSEGNKGDTSVFGIFTAIINYISGGNKLETLLLLSALLYVGRKDKFSMYLFYIALSLYIIKVFSNTEFGIETMGMYNVWEKLTEVVSEQEPDIEMDAIVPQGLEESMPSVSVIAVAAISAIAGMTAKKSLFDTLLNITKTNENQTKNVGAVIIFLSGSLHKFFSNLNMETLADYFYVQAVVDRDANKFNEKVITFTSSLESGCPTSQAFYVDTYQVLLNEGDALLHRLDKKSFDYTSVTASMKTLREEHAKVQRLKASLNGIRVEPVGVLIRGDPGIRKSNLTNRLISAITRATIPEAWKKDYDNDPKDFLFPLPKDKFFDGYTNKAWVTLCDDMYQVRDTVGMPDSDASRTINMINVIPYTLPMADAKSKNTVFFRSPFVFATTNLPRFNMLNSVSDPRAVERRWHITLDVKANPKYCGEDGKVDDSKLPIVGYVSGSGHNEQGTSLPSDMWIINCTLRTSNATMEKQNLTILQVAGLIVQSHHEKVKHFYINRASEDIFSGELDKNLNELLNNTTFAEDMYKTFKPVEESEVRIVPQAGVNTNIPHAMPGSFSQKWRDYYLERIDDVNFTFAVEALYYDLCKSLKTTHCGLPKMALFNAGVDRIDWHLRLLPNTEVNAMESLLPSESMEYARDLRPFFAMLGRSYQYMYERGLHPLNGQIYVRPPATNSSILLDVIKLTVKEWYDFIQTYKMTLLAGSAMLGIGVYWLGGFLSKTVPARPHGSVDDGKMMHNVGKNVQGKLSQHKHLINVNPQGFDLSALNFDSLPKLNASNFGVQNNSTDVIAKVFNKYFYILYVVENIKIDGGFKTMRWGHIINIKSDLFVMPFHFIYLMDEMAKAPGYNGATVVLITSTMSNRLSMPMEDFMHSFITTETSADMDICLVKVRGAHTNSIGVMNFLLKDNDIEKLKRYNTFDACIAGSSFSDLARRELLLRSCKVKARFSTNTVIKAKWAQDYDRYAIKDTVAYSSAFSTGDCGSILFVENTTFNNRSIMGFHVAGDESNGYSTILTYENMDSMLHELDLMKDCPFDHEEENKIFAPYTTIESQGSMQPIGKLFPKYAPSEVIKSEITKSALHSKLPPPYNIVKTLPCILKPFSFRGEEIDPGKIALSNYGCDPGCYPKDLLDEAVASYESLINTYTDTAREAKKVLNTEEALGSFGNLKPIASATSAGYPMNLPDVENLKVTYFDAVYQEDETARQVALSRIALAVTEVTLLYLEKIRPAWFFKDNLKDEKKKREKVLKGKTRMFSGSPFILLVMFRKYFGSFMDMYFKHNINIGSAIGVNPYSEHWNALARSMLKFADSKNDNIAGAGDYSGFDCHEQPEILYAILDIIQRWYGFADKEATHIRNCLWAEIVNSKHIFRGEVYEWNSSMPSGNPMTAVINTMYNNIIFRMAYGLSDCVIKNFNKEVYLCCLGDDNIFSVCRENRHKFNEITLPEAMKQIGMVYTTELKETATVPFRPINSIEFLKRSFSFNRKYNRWIAPLREESIVEMLDWTKKGELKDQITADNILGAIREFALHGEEKFNYWSQTLRDLKEKYLPEVQSNAEISWEFTKALKDVLDVDFYF